MKKIIFLLLLIVCVLFTSIPVSAQDSWVTLDSRFVPQEDIDTFFPSSEGAYFKIYNSQSIYDLKDQTPFEQWLTSSTHVPPTYANVLPDGTVKYEYTYVYDESKYELGDVLFVENSDWSDLYPYVLEPNRLFGDNVGIHILYCIDAHYEDLLTHNDQHKGIYIYYVTDHGDYVLHKPDPEANDIYVLPQNDLVIYLTRFAEYSTAYYKLHEHSYGFEPASLLDCGFDLEPYRLENFSLELQEPSDSGEPNAPQVPSEPTEPPNPGEQNAATENNASPAWYIWASVGLGGAVIGSGITLGAFHLRKKKKQS